MINKKKILFKNLYLKLKKFIKKDDIIYLESDLIYLLVYFQRKKFKNPLNFFFQLLNKLIGKNGTIILPTFTYSWGKSKIKNKIFDINKSKASTGIFPEYVRLNKNIRRTKDPMFSFIVFGKEKKKLSEISNNSFSHKSIFDKVDKKKLKLISFGLKKFDPTFVHYVEQYFNDNYKKINYRKNYELRGYFKFSSKKILGNFNCFLKIPNSKYIYNEKNIKKVLIKKKKLILINLLNNPVYIVKAADFFVEGINGMKKNTKFFVKIK